MKEKKMKEIKILQVIGGLNRGGAETMLMNLYRKIDRQKYKFDFLVYVTDDKKADYEDEILQNGDQIIKLDRNRVKNPILFYHDLNHVMKNSGYTCVHAHTLFNSGIVMYASYHNHIPVRITHSHSSGNMKRDTLINRTYFKFAKYLITKKIGILSFDLLKRRTNDLRKSRYFQYLMTYGEYFKELKIFNLFSVFIEKYKFYTKKFNDENLCLERKKAVSLSIVSIIETLVDGGLFSYIVYNGYIGTILIGNVLTYMKAITQVKQQMTVVLGTFSEIYKESFFIDQIIDYFQLLETNEERKIVINSIENIKIEDLSYKYKEGQDYILKNINLEIKRNETVAFVGQNGSGKTTLIKLIMGFYDDYEGNIYINGIELKKIDQKSLIDKIATVFQDYVKYQATFRENISYGNMSVFEDDSVLYSICEELGIKRLIENSENKLDSQIGHWFDNGMQISIGQWQKVALARAFIKNAELYILDEPNSALDSIAEADMLKLYEKIIRNHMGIIVTHKFNVLVKRVDRIVVLSEGVISGIGTHESLLKLNSDYRKMYEAQDITQ